MTWLVFQLTYKSHRSVISDEVKRLRDTYSLLPSDFFTCVFVVAIDESIFTRMSLTLRSSLSLLLVLPAILGVCISSSSMSVGETATSGLETGIRRLSRRKRLSEAQSLFTRRSCSICNSNKSRLISLGKIKSTVGGSFKNTTKIVILSENRNKNKDASYLQTMKKSPERLYTHILKVKFMIKVMF